MDPDHPAYPGGIVKVRDQPRPWLIRRDTPRRERRWAQEKAAREAGAKQREKMKARVRAYRKERAEAEATERAEVAKMTDAQRHAYYQQRQSAPIDKQVWPDGWIEACMEIEAEAIAAERQEREAREQDAGIPEARREWAAAQAAITARRYAAEREAGEICRASEQAAREKAQAELDALGPCPTIDDLEKVPA